uniref:Secreted protein n=1 Tax=Anser cygnoides TaxID=8845 RepID=A0A8B9ERI8_ANSCY
LCLLAVLACQRHAVCSLCLSSVRNTLKGCFPCLPCFHHSHLVFTYILASVPFLKALFVSFTFLVWIILKYEIHL